jgi:hypothetical protein
LSYWSYLLVEKWRYRIIYTAKIMKKTK